MEVDICRYNMEDVCMKPYPGNKELLALQVYLSKQFLSKQFPSAVMWNTFFSKYYKDLQKYIREKLCLSSNDLKDM